MGNARITPIGFAALPPSAARGPQGSGVDEAASRAILHPMDDKPTPPQRPTAPRPAPSKLAVRQEREAAALRANLRKRKDQARAREKPKQS
jgi:hypothetical protein